MSSRSIRGHEKQLNLAQLRNFLHLRRSHPNTNVKQLSDFRSSLDVIVQQRILLGRIIHSDPDLHNPNTLWKEAVAQAISARSKSENDLDILVDSRKNSSISDPNSLLYGASETCLQTVSLRPCWQNLQSTQLNNSDYCFQLMSLGVRTSRDLMRSTYVSEGHDDLARVSSVRGSSSVCVSQRQLALPSTITVEPNVAIRVPIIGYEIMEERARFTIFKLRVENPSANDCWLVLRRYTDFVRLNTKLRQAFPHINLQLPRKKFFGDNFNSAFLDNRVQGLQMFINSIMAKDELCKYKLVREFFCLDEPPTYSESMEECRAIFEAQEETIAHLKLQINNKNDLILSLQKRLRDEVSEKDQLKETLRYLAPRKCPNCAVELHHE